MVMVIMRALMWQLLRRHKLSSLIFKPVVHANESHGALRDP